MNGLHNLVASGKVLYVVRDSRLSLTRSLGRSSSSLGHLRYTSVDRREGQPICQMPGQDTVRDLPRRLEHPPA